MTNADRVIRFLASIAPQSASNDMIVARTGIRPHQQVFQITQTLLKDGRIAGRQLGKRWEFWFAGKETPTENVNGLPIPLQGIQKQVVQASEKPRLTVERLVASGFNLVAQWRIDELSEKISVHGSLPKEPGVYAFAVSGVALYVGVAKMGISRRLYFYGNPGSTQRTSRHLNQTIRDTLRKATQVEVYTAQPENLEWRSLPVSGIAGLEVGLEQSANRVNRKGFPNRQEFDSTYRLEEGGRHGWGNHIRRICGTG